MKRWMNLKEVLAILALLVIFAGLPATLWYWRRVMLPHHFPPGTKVISLTAVANGGIWTEQNVWGYDYWWHTPRRITEIPLNQGDHVVVLVHSADVQHSFAIPLLHVGPVEVMAGHTVEVPFDATRAGDLTFLCWQVCSPDHNKLRGQFVVKGNATSESW